MWPTCVSKLGDSLVFTDDLVNILTQSWSLSSSSTSISSIPIWSTAQSFGILISSATLNHFALQVCLKDWSCDMQRSLYTQSGILIHVERRSRARLCHLYRIINHLTSYLVSPHRKHFARTSQFRIQSFIFPRSWHHPTLKLVTTQYCFLTHIPYFISFYVINYTNTVLFWFHIHFSYLATHVTSAYTYIFSLLPAEII